MTEKDLYELESLQPWVQLTQAEHHELFRLARLGLKIEKEQSEKESKE